MSKQNKDTIADEEDVLQAVILADSFNKRFRPLTTQKPRCLLPICNAPLLDWTLESLALAGVQEVFVICRSHADLVKKAISESKWSKPGSGMKIVPIMTAKETFSPGDAMRDIYTRGLVTSDFVLVMGDLVSNIRIDEVVRAHKERRRTNKDAIMTMVVKESGSDHRTRAQGETSIFVIDPDTSECLHYEHSQGHPRSKFVDIPREILAGHPEIEIRNDLLDCSIDICSVEVPSLFQDNFDYLDIRRDFVHGILTSDILMKSIHCYIANEGYAARVQDTRSYESISKDILSRWTFPLVPDDNHPGGHIYEHTRGNRYIAKDNTVMLARTANIGTNTLIGPSTTVGENVSIAASVVGPHCTIGPGTTITDAYIFEGTTIGANCIIERSIIGGGVTVKDGSVIPSGCLIGDHVIIGPNAVLEQFERLSVKKLPAEDEDGGEDEEYDSDIEEVEGNQDTIDKIALGRDTNAIVWPRGPPDEEDDEDGPENWKNLRFMRLGDRPEYSEDEASSSSDDETSSDDDDDMHDLESLSGMSEVSIPLEAGGSGMMEEAEFQTEVSQSLERAFAEGHSVENAAVELKTLRMASNVPLRRVKEAVVAAIVEKIRIVEGDAAGQRKEIGVVVGRWGDLVNAIGGVDPVESVGILQNHCATSTRMPLFGQILAAFYQEDIVEEDDIRKWHKLPESNGDDRQAGVETENFKKCWVIGQHMIKQFDAQDESESESGTETETETEAEAGDEKAEKAREKTDDEETDSDSEEEEEAVAEVNKEVKKKEETESESEVSSEDEKDAAVSKREESESESETTGSEEEESEKETAGETASTSTKVEAPVVTEKKAGTEKEVESEKKPEAHEKVEAEKKPETEKAEAEKKTEPEKKVETPERKAETEKTADTEKEGNAEKKIETEKKEDTESESEDSETDTEDELAAIGLPTPKVTQATPRFLAQSSGASASSTPTARTDESDDDTSDSTEAADGGVSESDDVSASEESSRNPSANSSAANSEDEDESDEHP